MARQRIRLTFLGFNDRSWCDRGLGIGDGLGSDRTLTTNPHRLLALVDLDFGHIRLADHIDQFFYFSNIHVLLTLL